MTEDDRRLGSSMTGKPTGAGGPADGEPRIPRFSIENMDRSAEPARDFYRYAAGGWLDRNPVPSDKVRWGAFDELIQWNFHLLRGILEESAAVGSNDDATPRGKVGRFFASAMDQARIDRLGFSPIQAELDAIKALATPTDVVRAIAELHRLDIEPGFGSYVIADKRNSSVYAFYVMQGGLSLPDREYYLNDEFAAIRTEYAAHIARSLEQLGAANDVATKQAKVVLEMETALATASRPRADLRDEDRNYNRLTPTELGQLGAASHWDAYLVARGLPNLAYLVVGQPEFFSAFDALVSGRSIADWKTYLRWHVLHAYARFLHRAAENEHFEFFERRLRGQQTQEPRWKRSALVIDGLLGEALGQIYVEKYFPNDARARANELIDDLRAVFRDRLAALPWMSAETRAKALEKFARFSVKIGHPDRFRDYSSVEIRLDDYLGNVRRALFFEVNRRVARVGGPVDRTEWEMTPPTVNAYFNPTQNEIVFPAGILQPPFFDATADDAVNYGGIGAVIGHEITHGYDDQGRKYDVEGNLRDWWTEADAKEFDRRASVVIEAYNRFEALPGIFVNGELTLGENIADLGGLSIAFEALQRRLAREPARRRTIDGLTPEQRLFLAWAQVWRQNSRDEETRRRIAIDPHSPGRFRAAGAAANHPAFGPAFGVPEGSPTFPSAAHRATVW
ncbi:MAG: M13 family metallopeptidase [Thermoplasmata archaeon]|nr:M13 family metallopeptidase [Thermoplasmata archaeon]